MNNNQGQLPTDQDTFYDPVEDGAHDNREVNELTPEERARLQEEWKQELTKTEEEIDTLRRVLGSKLRHAQELKRKLGVTVWSEVQSDLAEGIKTVRESSAYVKTSETLKTAADKTNTMFQSLTGETKKKMGELRNTAAFRSVEGAVTGAVTAVKAKVSEVATPAADRERTTFESELNKVNNGSSPTTEKQ
ncbi:hypothetical protein BV898_04399 [Hypsibius exemplaris]|uniref:Tumor protein D54 n=1 Tax=Hypsibius exemplaris TaxID=2072580 RepID=A0A1W0X350_HYPEX|nr:hypothetical protein BV898_04399 [Hypsibius exemplaris]